MPFAREVGGFLGTRYSFPLPLLPPGTQTVARDEIFPKDCGVSLVLTQVCTLPIQTVGSKILLIGGNPTSWASLETVKQSLRHSFPNPV